MTPSKPHRHRYGQALVVLQFVLLLALALLAAPGLASGQPPVASLMLLAASAGLGFWTLAHNRLGNFNIHPEPRAKARLIVDGPYRLLRHPMYSAVLLLAAALAVLAGAGSAWAAWLALLAVLWLKSDLEERWLCEHYPDYDAFRRSRKRFIPWLL